MHIALDKKNTKTTIQPIRLDSSDSPSVQKLLDVLVSIMAEEYIQIAKQNPDLFSNNGGKK